MSCAARVAFRSNSSNPTQLESQRQATVLDIKTVFPVAQPHNTNALLQLKIQTAGGSPIIHDVIPPIRILELDIAEIMPNFPGLTLGTRGLYEGQTNKIILCTNNWCRETLIHETLHSTSFFPSLLSIGRKYRNFFEGITEFFTGYLMFLRYNDCYQKWKEKQIAVCSVTYEQHVKMWATFCRFIPVSELSTIYFWDGTNNWMNKVDAFIQTIQRKYPHFADFRLKPIPTIETRFLDECFKNFGRIQFTNIYNSPLTELLDFSKTLP